jgi:hypothetical protein
MITTQSNAALSDEDMQEIKQALDLIQAKMPFLITLSATERKRLYKMGDKRFAFVSNSLLAAQSNPGILPSSFDVQAYQNKYRLVSQMNELLLRIQQLQEQVDDTGVAVGSDAMMLSLTVYNYVKTAAKQTPGLKSLSEQLGTLFKAIRNKTPKGEPPTNPDAN